MMLTNMKLGLKLYIGFGLVLFFTAVISVAGIYSMKSIQARVRNAEDLDNIVKMLLKDREHEKNFIISKDSSHIENVHIQLNSLYEQLKITKDKFSQKINKDQMDQVAAEVKNYENAFDTYANLAKEKNAAMERMRKESADALTQAEAICESQKEQLEKSRAEHTELVKDKIAKTNDANQLFNYIMDAKAYRIFMMQGEKKYLDEWKAVGQKIYALTKDIRSRFKQEKNILQADKILEMYKKYEDAVLKYIDTLDEENRITMTKAADDVVEEMKAISLDQKTQFEKIQTDFEKELKERLDKANDANQIIRLFLTSRKNEKEFVISENAAFSEAAKKDYNKALKLGDELTSRFKNDENIRQGNILISSLKEYELEFDKFVSLTKEQWEAEKRMTENACKAQAVCDKVYADQKDKMHRQILFSEWIIVGGALLAIIIGFFSSFFITRNITVTLRKVTKFADKLSRGDLSERLPMGKTVNCSELLECGVKDCVCFGKESYCWSEAGTFSISPTCKRFTEGNSCRSCKAYKKSAPNELQEMGLALNAMADALNVKANIAISVARGDLTHKIHISSKNDSFGKAIKEMITGLNHLIRQVNEAVLQIDDGAAQVSDSSQSVSQGATEQASSLEEVTSSMVQISSQTRANAENAYQANLLSVKTRELAEEGMKEMANMILAMKDINEASQSIARIMKIIDEIAFQINLLSLNAAVEAARAGRYGKGFAVVAEEVRNLAGRSAKSAKETTELIENAFKKVKKGNDIADRTERALSKIVESVNKAADLIGEIAASSNEQSQALAQVNQGIGQIDQVTQQNAANAQQTASTAEELSAQASRLHQILEQFKLNNTDQPQKVNIQEYKNLSRVSRDKYQPESADSSANEKSADLQKQNEEGKMVRPEDVICFNDKEFEDF